MTGKIKSFCLLCMCSYVMCMHMLKRNSKTFLCLSMLALIYFFLVFLLGVMISYASELLNPSKYFMAFYFPICSWHKSG